MYSHITHQLTSRQGNCDTRGILQYCSGVIKFQPLEPLPLHLAGTVPDDSLLHQQRKLITPCQSIVNWNPRLRAEILAATFLSYPFYLSFWHFQCFLIITWVLSPSLIDTHIGITIHGLYMRFTMAVKRNIARSRKPFLVMSYTKCDIFLSIRMLANHRTRTWGTLSHIFLKGIMF